jgi:hypothetical protein
MDATNSTNITYTSMCMYLTSASYGKSDKNCLAAFPTESNTAICVVPYPGYEIISPDTDKAMTQDLMGNCKYESDEGVCLYCAKAPPLDPKSNELVMIDSYAAQGGCKLYGATSVAIV